MMPDTIHRLLRHAARDRRPGGGERPERPELWAFVARDRERLAEIAIQRTALIVVLEGGKEVTDIRGTRRFAAGEAMLIPAGWTGTVVNEPNPSTGHYRALVLEFPGEMVRRLLSAHAAPPPAKGRRQPDLAVVLTPTLAEAVHHAATGLAAAEPLPRTIVEHRCMEVLLALLEEGTWWLGPVAPTGVADAVRQLVRAYPDRPWTADSVARELGLSSGTLRRRLAEEDCSVRRLLTEERMAHARHLLESEGMPVQQAAEVCGYASRSHFARRLRAVAGANPSALRRQG